MKLAIACVLGLAAALAGCTTPVSSAVTDANKQLELKGSPFRYVARDDSSMVMTLLPLPAGKTRAVPELAQQAIDAIATAERKKGRPTALLEEVRYLQDGREVWVLQALGSGIAYVVAFANPSQPGSDMRITGPTTYQR
jgi:hypothetical protein